MQQQTQQTQQAPQSSSKASFYNNAMVQSLRKDGEKTALLRDEELRYGQGLTLMYREMINQASRKFIDADNKRGNVKTGDKDNPTGNVKKVANLKKDDTPVVGDVVTGKETPTHVNDLLTKIGSGLKSGKLFDDVTGALGDAFTGLIDSGTGFYNKAIAYSGGHNAMFNDTNTLITKVADKYKAKGDSIFDKYSTPPLNRSTRLKPTFDDLKKNKNTALSNNTKAYRVETETILEGILNRDYTDDSAILEHIDKALAVKSIADDGKPFDAYTPLERDSVQAEHDLKMTNPVYARNWMIEDSMIMNARLDNGDPIEELFPPQHATKKGFFAGKESAIIHSLLKVNDDISPKPYRPNNDILHKDTNTENAKGLTLDLDTILYDKAGRDTNKTLLELLGQGVEAMPNLNIGVR